MKQGVFDFESLGIQADVSEDTTLPPSADVSQEGGDEDSDLSVLAALDKLEAIKVDNASRLDVIDQQFVDAMYNHYQAVKTLFCEFLDRLKSINERMDLLSYKDEGHILDRLRELPRDYVKHVVWHFERRYNVDLDENRIINELGSEEPDTEKILDRIFAQLGGATFAEMAVRQIKASLQSRIWDAPEIKGSRLMLPRFIYAERSWNGKPKLSYNSQEHVVVLLKALQHFESGDVNLRYPFKNVCDLITAWDGNPFEKHEIDGEKVKAIRLYINGKVEITFAGHTEASAFAQEYARPRERH